MRLLVVIFLNRKTTRTVESSMFFMGSCGFLMFVLPLKTFNNGIRPNRLLRNRGSSAYVLMSDTRSQKILVNSSYSKEDKHTLHPFMFIVIILDTN